MTRTDIAWTALLFIVIALYFGGLGSPYAPTNGDEMVYIHIARMTAESGHWLPLQSELAGMRNTKPPLLIWQAMVAGGWGQWWNLWTLRLPSVLYTLATTALLGLFVWRISRTWRNTCIAMVLYLLLFSTFRYGRTYLTTAPETFWLSLPMWWVLWLRTSRALPSSQTLGAIAYTGFGIAMGVGAVYKSFALIAPASAALWLAWLLSEPALKWRTVLHTTAGVAWSAAVGLGIFALWFVLDPDPAAVWQEFVVAENAGKMSGGMGYWHAALYGAYPMWVQLFALPENAGLLALPVLGFCLWTIIWLVKRPLVRPAPATAVLLVWLVVWMLVFMVPSQRSARYVIPAMPALAIAMALIWDRLPKVWSWLTLLIMLPVLVVLGRISWVIGQMEVGTPIVLFTALAVCTLGGIAVVFGLVRWRCAAGMALASCAAVYAAFGLMVAPLSTPESSYPLSVQQQMVGKRVVVPNGFNGQYERFHFVFPGARITPYDADGRNTGALYPDMPPKDRLQTLLGEFDAVVWLQDDLSEMGPSCQPQCQVIAQRWHVKSRHKEGEVTLDNLWQPQQWLFRREWLVVPSAPAS
jgi:4-amino-4-deoxy-L-arabinose transferase-like glycosyltransferase